MKKAMAWLSILMLLCGTALADRSVTVSTRSGSFYIDPSEWMPSVQGQSLHQGRILSAEPSDWGSLSDNGVLMVRGGYTGIIRTKHWIYRLQGRKKTLISEQCFTVKIVPQRVSIKKAFQIDDGAVQVRFCASVGADFYRVAIGKGQKVLKVRDTFNLSKDFKGLEKGVYWVMVCAVADVYGTELVSYASERVKVVVK